MLLYNKCVNYIKYQPHFNGFTYFVFRHLFPNVPIFIPKQGPIINIIPNYLSQPLNYRLIFLARYKLLRSLTLSVRAYCVLVGTKKIFNLRPYMEQLKKFTWVQQNSNTRKIKNIFSQHKINLINLYKCKLILGAK